jgi:hypothetical protein
MQNSQRGWKTLEVLYQHCSDSKFTQYLPVYHFVIIHSFKSSSRALEGLGTVVRSTRGSWRSLAQVQVSAKGGWLVLPNPGSNQAIFFVA